MSDSKLSPSDWRIPLLKGMTGSDCAAWQSQLIEDLHDLAPWNADGDFGGCTHNATVSWQKDRGLKGDGWVGEKTIGAIGSRACNRPEPELAETDPSQIKFVKARNYGVRGNKTITRKEVQFIVIHTMEAGEASTTAENVAAWIASKASPVASWHYAVDDDSIVQSVRENHIAWHAAGGNRVGIGIEHAGYARQTAAQWNDQFSRRMLKRSALLCARICGRWNIPAVRLTVEDIKDGRKGFCGHNEVSTAFNKSDHYDPGDAFPWDHYLEMVADNLP